MAAALAAARARPRRISTSAKRWFRQALWSRGIRHLDAVALSHAHSDHMGGLPAVLRNFHPDELWVGNNPRFGAYNALLDEAAALQVRLRTLRAGDALHLGSTQIAVLAPFPRLSARRRARQQRLAGAARGLRRDFGAAGGRCRSADRSRPCWPSPALQSTLLKVGHHGSITSTRPEFLARVAPQWAVISCGLHNRYGHPRQEVLEELQARMSARLRTDIDGATCFELNGRGAAMELGCGKAVAP